MNSIKNTIYSFLVILIISPASFAQLPTGIDPGSSDPSVSIFEQPEYIIPIIALFVILIGYYTWRKRKK